MNKVLLTKDFKKSNFIFIKYALYVSSMKSSDEFSAYDGESVKCISEFIINFSDYIANTYNKKHIINKFMNKTIDALQRSIDSKIDRKLYSRILEDNLTDLFEEILVCFYNGFNLGFLEVIPLLDENDKLKYYYYDSEMDEYVLKNEVPYNDKNI